MLSCQPAACQASADGCRPGAGARASENGCRHGAGAQANAIGCHRRGVGAVESVLVESAAANESPSPSGFEA